MQDDKEPQWEIIESGYDETPENHLTYQTVQNEYAWKATVKWDGCIHLWEPPNSLDERNYMHICDIDNFINMLQSLKREVCSRVIQEP